jgi:hypothetical protein
VPDWCAPAASSLPSPTALLLVVLILMLSAPPCCLAPPTHLTPLPGDPVLRGREAGSHQQGIRRGDRHHSQGRGGWDNKVVCLQLVLSSEQGSSVRIADVNRPCLAQATATGLRMLAQELKTGGGTAAAQLRVAEQYVEVGPQPRPRTARALVWHRCCSTSKPGQARAC